LPDFNDVIPETQRLDSSLQKARAQLSAKGRRQRPSRSRLRDSISSTEGEEILEKKVSSPLSGPSPFARTAEFSFDTSTVRRSLDQEDQPSSPLIRYRPLTNTSSQEALGGHPHQLLAQVLPQLRQFAYLRTQGEAQRRCLFPSGSSFWILFAIRLYPFVGSSNSAPYDSRDTSPPEPASPTIGLDKKTRRKFLDLGVTLRRASSGKSRKEKGGNRLSMGNRELVEGSGRPSVSPFMPFSWFTDSGKGSASSGSTASPTSSPKNEAFSRKKSASQESTLSDDSTPPSSSPKTLSTVPPESKCSYPYHTLSQSSDEFLDEPLSAASTWSSQKVGQWLESLSLEQYMAEFAAQEVDGHQLLTLDGTKLKALGVSNSHDRSLLKRKLKELNAAVEKEKKAQEKVEKQKEKQKKKERDQEQKKS
ncbi:hypothetical protein lerEdw1_005944, partial [Lerista edwardsae]